MTYRWCQIQIAQTRICCLKLAVENNGLQATCMDYSFPSLQPASEFCMSVKPHANVRIVASLLFSMQYYVTHAQSKKVTSDKLKFLRLKFRIFI